MTNKEEFWHDELKPILMWYCLEKHAETLVRIGVQQNADNIKWTYDMIGQICESVFEEYYTDEDNDESDK